jgi:hypothetical protein
MPTLTAPASLSVIVILALARDTGLLNDGIDRPPSCAVHRLEDRDILWT